MAELIDVRHERARRLADAVGDCPASTSLRRVSIDDNDCSPSEAIPGSRAKCGPGPAVNGRTTRGSTIAAA